MAWYEDKSLDSTSHQRADPPRTPDKDETICLRRVLEYFGHIATKDHGSLEKLMVTGKVNGRRPRGRGPTRWSDQIRTTLDTTVHDALHSAADRGGHDPQY
ncbi:uncharacterized protein LOC134201580 [Bombyx mori]|uniref:uncharacterized protein LOC134201580 n=1 Tax=Bombyx mori TaxID=7091 RepID=UPI002ED05235